MTLSVSKVIFTALLIILLCNISFLKIINFGRILS